MRKALLITPLVVLASLPSIPSALAAEEFDQYRVESVSTALSSTQAGAHADVTVSFELSEKEGSPYALTRDVIASFPQGFTGNPKAFPTCTAAQLGVEPLESECPPGAQVGSTDITLGATQKGTFENEPIYNMPVAGSGEVARLGFFAGIYPMAIGVHLDPDTEEVVASVEGAPSLAALVGASSTVWGVPSDESHDPERITPKEVAQGNAPPGGHKSTLTGETPFMTNPTKCGSPGEATITARSYALPGSPSTKSAPFAAITGCGALEFNPSISAKPTTAQATSATGLEYEMSMPAKGLEFGKLPYGSEVKRVEAILPEGMTLNPSAAQGLGVCSEADLSHERYDSAPNEGCPESSKIGNITATSPVIDRDATGALFLAKPYENPFGSLLALYLVVKIPDRGVLVKLPGKVSPDPKTGQIITTFDDIPQLPVGTVSLHFREGARAPLVTPPTCGTYQIATNLTPWANPSKATQRSNAFTVGRGPEHGACPQGGTPPFNPGFEAGSINNAAGSFSAFDMRLTRRDGDQDLTRFSAKLPPGMIGRLAGVSECPDSAIARAASRTGIHGGHEELNDPSCPANSQIGHVLAGAGVGQVLTYAEGKLYLAGPYKGAPLSVVAIVPAVAGPFDVGVVVTREALRIDPLTAEVEADGSSSDPIPHILAGIPLKVRDVRVYVDRPNFTLNPTSCEPSATKASVWGGGADVFSPADDLPFGLSARFQAADCASLGFKPRLSLTLKGGTRRGAFPALHGVYAPRAGDANLSSLVLRLPHSAFLEQGHFGTICTRVQFAAAACPERSVYGTATAYTPLLSEPLTGPVYLRSSSHNLPDFVADLHGIVDVEAVARIDSKEGGIRATFPVVPDAPLTKVVVDMQGGKKGLIVNSTNLCASKNRADAQFTAHNGKRSSAKPLVKAAGCKKHRRGKRNGGSHK